ncbi:MAG: hypothetical protein JXB00_12720 [Bacteroidales bacterium]|nr:hypothetical protein [Bacteroidales bacterium]
MKNYYLLLVLIFLSKSLHSQDKIITKKGDEILCDIIQVSADNIYFNQFKNGKTIYHKKLSKRKISEVVLVGNSIISADSLNKITFIDYTVENTWDTIFTYKGDTLLCMITSTGFNYKPVYFKYSFASPSTTTISHKEIYKLYSHKAGYFENVKKGKVTYLLSPVLKGEVSLYYLYERAAFPFASPVNVMGSLPKMPVFSPGKGIYLLDVKFKNLFIVRDQMVDQLSIPFSSKRLYPYMEEYPDLIQRINTAEYPLDYKDVIIIVAEFNNWYTGR